MKAMRLLILAAIILLSPLLSHAQFIKSVGLKFGTSMSTLSFSDIAPANYFGSSISLALPKWKYVFNPSIGLYADILNSPEFALQTDLTFLRAGGRWTSQISYSTPSNPDGTGAVATYTSEISLQYLVFSVAAQPKLPVGDLVVYADVRPTLSYLLEVSNVLSFNDNVTRIQLGYSLGVGFDFTQILGRSVFLELCYAGDSRSFYDYGYAKLWSHSWRANIGTRL